MGCEAYGFGAQSLEFEECKVDRPLVRASHVTGR